MDEEQTDGMVATESIAALKHFADSGEPFFMGVGFYRPHTPFVAPKQYYDLYDLADIEVPRVPTGYLETLPEPAAKSLQRWPSQIDLDEETARKAILAYYASISFLDAQVGRVMAALDELGLRENTVVVFTSDHGYHMGEHGYYQKTTLFEHADRVPLIVSAPGQPSAGQHTSAMVEMIDFYHSLADLAGVASPPGYVQGRSFAGVLADPETTAREDVITQLANGYSLRTPRYRFTKWVGIEGRDTELYDRLSDPAEMVNLAEDPVYADVVAQLMPRLDARIEEISTLVPGVAFTPPEPEDSGYHRDRLAEVRPDPVAHATFAEAIREGILGK